MLRRICKSNIKPFQTISNNNNYIKLFSTSDPRFGKYEPGKTEADPQKTLEKEALEANKRYIEKKWLKWNVLTSITLIVFFGFWLTGPSDGEVEEKVEEHNPNKKVSNVLGWKIEVERVQNPKSKFFSKTGHGSMPEPYQMPPPSSATQN